MQADDVVGAGERLSLIDEQRQRAKRAVTPTAGLLYGVWGLAYLVAYLTLWFTSRDGSSSTGEAIGYTVYGVSIITALVVTAAHVGRRVAGVRGVSATMGRRYFFTWIAAFGGYGALMSRIGATDGVPDDLRQLVASLLAPLLVGVIYMAAAAVVGDSLMFRVGLWLAAVAGAAALIGAPHHLLVMALLGGGGMLVAAGWSVAAGRRSS